MRPWLLSLVILTGLFSGFSSQASSDVVINNPNNKMLCKKTSEMRSADGKLCFYVVQYIGNEYAGNFKLIFNFLGERRPRPQIPVRKIIMPSADNAN